MTQTTLKRLQRSKRSKSSLLLKCNATSNQFKFFKQGEKSRLIVHKSSTAKHRD